MGQLQSLEQEQELPPRRGPQLTGSSPHDKSTNGTANGTANGSAHGIDDALLPAGQPLGQLTVSERVARIRERMLVLLRTVGEQHKELTAATKRIEDLELDAARQGLAAAQGSAEVAPLTDATATAATATTAAPHPRSSQGHELTHLKCAVLEFIRADPNDAAKRAQLTAIIATYLHFSKKETEAALAIARQRPLDSDPLAFLGGLLS